jgi:hypothetical protein
MIQNVSYVYVPGTTLSIGNQELLINVGGYDKISNNLPLQILLHQLIRSIIWHYSFICIIKGGL